MGSVFKRNTIIDSEDEWIFLGEKTEIYLCIHIYAYVNKCETPLQKPVKLGILSVYCLISAHQLKLTRRHMSIDRPPDLYAKWW